MRYIVTGGAGFVGSHLVEQLIEKQHDVIVIDNLSKGKKENLSKVIDRIKFLDLDIRDYTSMEQNIRKTLMPSIQNYLRSIIYNLYLFLSNKI